MGGCSEEKQTDTYASSAKTDFIIAVGGKDSEYYSYGKSMILALNQKLSGISVNILETTDPELSLLSVKSSQADLAIVSG